MYKNQNICGTCRNIVNEFPYTTYCYFPIKEIKCRKCV